MREKERIRARAHAMWEREGRPEGREMDHWLEAEAELKAADRWEEGEEAAPDAEGMANIEQLAKVPRKRRGQSRGKNSSGG
ncbi:hypothetical protein MesoLjLc_62950 [Mesorhizobium sp. L-8-10]|uniref:DUF2934 domain-containing protein n=1 Tax=unclassified Mesorhizobium TaxID=325217 RepID=UPI0019256D6B|nr:MULTISPECIES: DUF2934 domain-containing protein [unclassified Mesorhizobium]BCH26379.1 hypothetical protein MesoLjLb_61640 [Mesorhizobium sp. L-8-3]BCH34365.1 hypothetical protein MesoLjLc_62950 [Mesorhizobium sp. L-8-10]